MSNKRFDWRAGILITLIAYISQLIFDVYGVGFTLPEALGLSKNIAILLGGSATTAFLYWISRRSDRE